jgi:membrane protease YdiL (CAAX protease family)
VHLFAGPTPWSYGAADMTTEKPSSSSRGVAVAEVALAFALAHVAFRSFRHFTVLGRAETGAGVNLSPGAALVLVALAFLLAGRRALPRSGLTARPFAPSVHAALLCLLALALCGAIALACGAPFERPPVSPEGTLGPVAVNLAGTVLLLSILSVAGSRVDHLAVSLGLSVLVLLPLLPVGVALLERRPLGQLALEMGWLLGGAGVGEEVFFRGYVQSRLNEAFGRPWRLFGVEFGFGMFGAAALFGLVHVLNGVDYFSGTYGFMWWHGIAAGTTLFYGFLRERYGTVLPAVLVHGYGDLLLRMPRLIQGGDA